jgi:hypothetical protein
VMTNPISRDSEADSVIGTGPVLLEPRGIF